MSVVNLWKSSDQSLSEKKLHSSPKPTTSQGFQTVILVLSFSYEKSVYDYIPCTFYIASLVLYWPVDLGLIVKT